MSSTNRIGFERIFLLPQLDILYYARVYVCVRVCACACVCVPVSACALVCHRVSVCGEGGGGGGCVPVGGGGRGDRPCDNTLCLVLRSIGILSLVTSSLSVLPCINTAPNSHLYKLYHNR